MSNCVLGLVRQVSKIATVEDGTNGGRRHDGHHQQRKLGRDHEHGSSGKEDRGTRTQTITNIGSERFSDNVGVHAESANDVSGSLVSELDVLAQRRSVGLVSDTLDDTYTRKLEQDVAACFSSGADGKDEEHESGNGAKAKAEECVLTRSEEVDQAADCERHSKRDRRRDEQETESDENVLLLRHGQREETPEIREVGRCGRGAIL